MNINFISRSERALKIRYMSRFCDFTFRRNFQYVWYDLLKSDVDLRQQKSVSVFWRQKKIRFWIGMFRKLKSRNLRSISKSGILWGFPRDDAAATSAWRSSPSSFFLEKTYQFVIRLREKNIYSSSWNCCWVFQRWGFLFVMSYHSVSLEAGISMWSCSGRILS